MWLPFAGLAGVISLFAFIRIRFLSFPLERDEGEYAYAGQLILHGINPFKLCYSMKLPGTAAAYALFTAIFGQTQVGAHLGLLLVNAASIVLTYFLAARLFGRLAGVVAAASFALLSLEPSVLGLAGHATQFVALPALAGILLLLRAIDSQKQSMFFLSGLLLGLAFLMKQPGLLFTFFALFYLAYSERQRGFEWRRFSASAGMLIFAAAIPFALTCLFMLQAGVFDKFWFWTFAYAQKYAARVTLAEGLEFLAQTGSEVIRPAALLWIIAATGAIVSLWSPKQRNYTVFLFSFLAFSFVAVSPGLYFRNHYFVLLLPAVSLLCGAAVGISTTLLQSEGGNPWAVLVPPAIFAVAFGLSMAREAKLFFHTDPLAACHLIYGPNPFPEALKIADFISAHSSPDDRIAVIGSEPEIYFYANRHSATGYVYVYPLVEPQPFAPMMQREMISEIETARPRFIVLVDDQLSWLGDRESEMGILSWAERYVGEHYQEVGIADLLRQGTEYRWGEAVRTYRPESKFKLAVFERRN
ncbi:MAG TPA: glycosyltransferase family 39 protein [Candidatus Binatia bacterium]|nr:glycosyltransferase family 39 protein [Candidatus Binatia bacterium]